MPNYFCDLHMHTNRSDGSDTPKELIDRSSELGMTVIAITDHDIRPPQRIPTDQGEIDIVEYAKAKGLLLLLGIEISCETNIEDTHIIGFGCDWESSYFADLEKSVVNSKIEGYRTLVDELSKSGIDITWEEVLENNGSPVLENSVQKKMIFELIARKGYTKSWNDAKQMVKTTPSFQINRKKPSAISAIRAIHDTGGASILAHPYLIADFVQFGGSKLSRDEFIRILIAEGLNGIEARYTYDKTSYAGSLTKEQIANEVVKKFGTMVDVISGGSDYHADHKKGVANAREIGEAGISTDYLSSNSCLQRLCSV